MTFFTDVLNLQAGGEPVLNCWFALIKVFVFLIIKMDIDKQNAECQLGHTSK